MQISHDQLKELLVHPGHVSDAVFGEISEQAEKTGVSIEEILVDRDLIRDDQLGKLIAESNGFPFVDLSQVQIDENVFNLLPELVAKKMEVIAYARVDDKVNIGMVNPDDLETRHFVEKRLGVNVVPHAITKNALKNILDKYKSSLIEQYSEILKKLKDSSLSQEERDKVTINMVDTLMQYGYKSKASDIHIEPSDEKLVVRFRIDGVLHDVLQVPKMYGDLILTRIKIMSRMRTDEHRAAQDGKFRLEINGNETADVRVSIVPVVDGENVVMRLLSSQNRQISLTDLGLSPNYLSKVEKSIANPHGMILTTGPTGSGKTTTIYAILKILNKREVHISTIEDPVEYDVEGISQIQVDAKTNLTFAKGLRAIVRQDPDIIMVGEIRDSETAGIAINSAMTGHLVLSTLHANDAPTTLPRLFDMGIEPFLIASTVNVVMAQRLVRKICNSCKASSNLNVEEQQAIERDPVVKEAILRKVGINNVLENLTVYRGVGCKICGQTGYKGRIGIFEVLEISELIKQLIVKRSSSDEIMKVAKQEGMTTMLEDGMDKVINGVTTIGEVLRAAKG